MTALLTESYDALVAVVSRLRGTCTRTRCGVSKSMNSSPTRPSPAMLPIDRNMPLPS